MGIFRRSVPTPATEQPAVTAARARKTPYSHAATQVFGAFMLLPEDHRPAYDVKTMVEALDRKYGVGAVNDHLEVWDYDGWGDDPRVVSLDACTCRYDYDEDGYVEDEIYGATCDFPEYLTIYEAIQEIQEALSERKRAIEAQIRAAELAGIEYELQDVSALTEALRRETVIIREVTDEIFVAKTPAAQLA